jgi:hypothetical protein
VAEACRATRGRREWGGGQGEGKKKGEEEEEEEEEKRRSIDGWKEEAAATADRMRTLYVAVT